MLRTKFASEINDLKEDLVSIFNLSLKQHVLVIEALKNEDSTACKQIIANDNIINDKYAKFLENATWRIAKQQPVADDLRHILGYMAIAKEIERIGDYARNIALFYLNTKAPLKYIKYISRMAEKTLLMLKTMQHTIINESKWSEVTEIIKMDDIIDNEYNEISAELVNIVLKNVTAKKIQIYSGIMQQLKYLERTGDQIVNIAEVLLYILQKFHYDSGR